MKNTASYRKLEVIDISKTSEFETVNFKCIEATLGSMRSWCKYIFSLVSFPSPFNKIVACSANKWIGIWGSEDLKFHKKIDEHSSWVRCLTKWKEDQFLSASEDGIIGCFSITPPFKTIKTIDAKSPIYSVLKITDDLFAASHCDKSRIFLISFSKGKVVGEIEMAESYATVQLKRSLIFKHHFFYNSVVNSSLRCVRFVEDSQNLEEFQEFLSPILPKNKVSSGTRVAGFTNILHKNKEIIIANPYGHLFYLYDIHGDRNSKKIDPSENIELFECKFSSCISLNNQYIVCGTTTGDLLFFELEFLSSQILLKKIGERKMFSGKINDLREVSRTLESVKLACCSQEGEIAIGTFKGLKFKRDEEDEDMIERTEFLVLRKEEYIFSDETKKKMFINISLRNQTIQNCFRVLLST